MPVLQPIIGGMPTLLELVNQSLIDCNQNKVTTLVGAKPVVQGMAAAINDAIIDIYTRAKWNWLNTQAPIDMESGVTDYPVPPDFGFVAQDILIGDKKITFVPYEKFTTWPGVNGFLNTFTFVHPSTLRFSPVPNDDFVAQWPQVMLSYTRRPVQVFDDSDVPNLPMEFQDVLKAAARRKWKRIKEYSPIDIQDETATYEGALMVKLQSYLRDPSRGHGMRMRANGATKVNYRGF